MFNHRLPSFRNFEDAVQFWATLFVVSCITLSLRAEELVENYQSIRALGIGGAFTTIVDNSDALFYNPAALSNIQGYHWTIMDPSLGINGQEAAQTVTALQSATGPAALEELYGKRLWVGGGLKTAIGMANFALAGFDYGHLAFDMTNASFPNLNISARNDLGFIGGLAIPIVKGSSFGINVKRYKRVGATVPIGASSIATFSSSTLSANTSNVGTGIGLDLGLLVSLDTPVKPTFSFVWKDAGYTSFAPETGSVAPATIRDEMIGGFALHFDSTLVSFTPVVDFKYANRADIQLGKKIHFGGELSTPIFDLRTGFYQGYYTLGAGIDLAFIRLDVATWGVELGEYPGQHEDRRYALQLTIDLGINMDFNLFGEGKGKDGSGGSGRHRLKQRR